MTQSKLRLERLTSLILPLTAHPSLTAYRKAHVAPGEASLPPHITLYTPFIYADEFGPEARALFREFAARQPVLTLTLVDVGTFPAAGVLYLRPGLSEGLTRLRQRLLAAVPALPADMYTSRTFRLTIARVPPSEVEAEQQRCQQFWQGQLPLMAKLDALAVYEYLAPGWQQLLRCPLMG